MRHTSHGNVLIFYYFDGVTNVVSVGVTVVVSACTAVVSTTVAVLSTVAVSLCEHAVTKNLAIIISLRILSPSLNLKLYYILQRAVSRNCTGLPSWLARRAIY